MTTLEWDEVFDCAVAAWCRSSTSQEMLRMCFQSRTQQNEVSVGWTANELMAFATGIARLVASPTPPAEQPIGEVVVTKTRDGQIISVTRQDDEGRILSVIATSDPADLEATTGAALGGVYAELPTPNLPRGGFPDLFTERQMRDFADRTHALRMEQAAPKAAPVKACVCGEPQASGTVHRVDGPCYVAAPQQEPCQTCIAMARTVMMDQVSFDRKPDCYGIRQITDDEGVEEWEDIRTSPDVAREEANDMMATGRGEIYEVVPLWTTPQPAPAPLSDGAKDAARLAKITQAIRDYHFALDCREHGGVAMARAWNAICDVLNMDWVQGAESAARKQGANHD